MQFAGDVLFIKQEIGNLIGVKCNLSRHCTACTAALDDKQNERKEILRLRL